MNKKVKIFLISNLFIIGTLVGLRIYVGSVLKEIVTGKVKEYSKDSYSLKVNKIEIGLLAINATIEGVHLKHNLQKDDSLNNYINLSAKSIKLRGLKLFKLLTNRTLELNKFELIDPIIDIHNNNIADSSDSKSNLKIFNLKLNKLVLQNAKLNFISRKKNKSSLKLGSVIYNARNQVLEINNLNISSKDSSGALKTVNLNIGLLTGFNLETIFKMKEFTYQDASLSKLSLNIINPNETKGASKLNISQVDNIFENKFLATFKPLKIKRLEVSITQGTNKSMISGDGIDYGNRDFKLERINFSQSGKKKMEFSANELQINGIIIDTLKNGYGLSLEKVSLQRPDFKIEIQKDSSNNVKQKDTSISFASYFNIRFIKSFLINKGAFNLKHNKSSLTIAAKNINLEVKNIIPDSLSVCENLKFKASDIFVNLPNNLYHIETSQIRYEQKNASVLISSLKFKSNYTQKNFSKHIKKQTGRIDLTVQSISAAGFDLLKLINQKILSCSKILMDKANLEIYKDRTIPLAVNDYKKLPQELLRDAGLGITINSIEFRNSRIVSEVLSARSDKAGIIEIDRVNMLFKGVDNTSLAANKVMEIDFYGRLAKSGILKVNALMPINDPNCKHTVKLDLGKMPIQNINTLINDFLNVSITKGQLDRASAVINGNKKNINCKLDLYYHDLSMKILSNDSSTKKYILKKVGTKVVNMLIRNNNPDEGLPIRKGNKTIEVQSNIFIVNNWLKATLMAMLEVTSPTGNNLLEKRKEKKKKRMNKD